MHLKKGDKIMEVFSIVEKVDVNKLNGRIISFIQKCDYNPYIFANEETIKSIAYPEPVTVTADKDFVCRYQGCRMFKDYTKNFGEIELR